MGWALDGFGIYSYQDVGGAAPVVDECGGHFGPVDTGAVEYHYHSRQIVPYHLACQESSFHLFIKTKAGNGRSLCINLFHLQGPSLGRCAETQQGTNYCHPGCGSDYCVQPGTSEGELRDYLAQWDEGWYGRFTVNDF